MRGQDKRVATGRSGAGRLCSSRAQRAETGHLGFKRDQGEWRMYSLVIGWDLHG